jgi:hypothetical protein
MKIALLVGILAAAGAGGSAMATGSAPRPSHAAPHPRAERQLPAAGHPVTEAAIQRRIAAWSAAHPGWTNPADMTHAQMLEAEIAHPAVYAPYLNRSSKALRIIQVYGTWATMSPRLRALERAQGVPIPAGIPYVPPSAYIPAARLALVKTALRNGRRP